MLFYSRSTTKCIDSIDYKKVFQLTLAIVTLRSRSAQGDGVNGLMRFNPCVSGSVITKVCYTTHSCSAN